ncbi:MAG TPA: NAD-dependent epimerase/dehydratase family protein [Actinomycetota bacterium]|nr:NAD-dependent epimerase/dehydratase family protein [Actinomycetota bacterium]
MNALVTGAAGFVGSHLVEHLLESGDLVRGVDCFTGYYDRAAKESNVRDASAHPRFTFVEADVAATRLTDLLTGIDAVYHLAGQPGVRPSWGRDFDHYTRQNITTTQRLLEAARSTPLRSFVYASSSSVYGDADAYPTAESALPRPLSPYGVTKLAGEHLCELYRSAFGISTASLRLFTVYGPRQRPDMAFARLMSAARTAGTFELSGDGTQTRDFTDVSDVVFAMRRVAVTEWRGVANIGGGAQHSMNEVVAAIETITGRDISVVRRRSARGDVKHTGADVTRAREGFGYRPRVALTDGLAAMWAWAREQEAAVA